MALPAFAIDILPKSVTVTISFRFCPYAQTTSIIMYRALRFTQQRQFVSSLFGITFVAAVLTVSASSILPCPARPLKGRHADDDDDDEITPGGPPASVTVAKRPPRRWIQEVRHTPKS